MRDQFVSFWKKKVGAIARVQVVTKTESYYSMWLSVFHVETVLSEPDNIFTLEEDHTKRFCLLLSGFSKTLVKHCSSFPMDSDVLLPVAVLANLALIPSCPNSCEEIWLTSFDRQEVDPITFQVFFKMASHFQTFPIYVLCFFVFLVNLGKMFTVCRLHDESANWTAAVRELTSVSKRKTSSALLLVG